jgi:hypothetical protein
MLLENYCGWSYVEVKNSLKDLCEQYGIKSSENLEHVVKQVSKVEWRTGVFEVLKILEEEFSFLEPNASIPVGEVISVFKRVRDSVSEISPEVLGLSKC